MLGLGRFLRKITDPGQRARAVHSVWLTWALDQQVRMPRIPTRPVSQGGFERMMANQAGREHAQKWWDAALKRVHGPGCDDDQGA